MHFRSSVSFVTGAATLMLACLSLACAGVALAGEIRVQLDGKQVVPPVETTASGSGSIVVGPGRRIGGSIRIRNLEPFAAHIHQGAAADNGPPVGPPIIWLEKTGPNVWSVPAGASLNEAQYASFLAGKLYIQFHTEAHKAGEIRGQIRPGGAAH